MYLRFTTAGSVDDGKSTLIGRLLYDTKSLYEDQWEAVQKASAARKDEEVDLALLTDGLRAEREQKITIDVAYRYFSTPNRKFIIADTPGHEQYTRNMVTGASTAELAILLVDARKGITTQTRRHAFISTLLGIPHLVVAINKMDMVDYAQDVHDRIVAEFEELAQRLEIKDIAFIPLSALRGDNVVEGSLNMPWYQGPTLLRHLETVNIGSGRNVVDFRFPVQYVVRPNQDFRGFAGQIASGRVRPGQSVVVLPSGRETRIQRISTPDGDREEAFAGDSVVITLEHEVDASRGSLLVRSDNLPQKSGELDVTLCWLSETPLRPGAEYVLMHSSRAVRCFPQRVNYRVDVNSMQRQSSGTLSLNEIGRVQLSTTEPLFFDPYRVNRASGSLILIDPDTNNTVAAGMIRGRSQQADDLAEPQSEEQRAIFPTAGAISLERREARNGHKAAVVWLTGLSGSGKTTLAKALETALFDLGCQTAFLDGDNLRQGLCSDLGFSERDRELNVQRAAHLAQHAFGYGQIVICSLISPFEKDRRFARTLFPEGRFLEVHVSCDLEVCRQRDPKGLYKRAQEGSLKELTGLSSPYQAPERPELKLATDTDSVQICLQLLLQALRERKLLPASPESAR